MRGHSPGARCAARLHGKSYGLVLVVLVALIALAAGCDANRPADGRLFGPHANPGSPTAAPHAVAVARDDRDAAVLDVVSGATTVTVRAADLGDTLARASTPDDSALAPSIVETDADLQVHLADTGLTGPEALVVELNKDVAWRLRFSGGATEVTVDGAMAARVDGVDLASGVTRAELGLPAPHGTTQVRVAGGASDVAVHLPSGPPAKVSIGGGAATVKVDGATHSGVSAGTVFAPSGWDAADDRFDIAATSGVSTLTVDRLNGK
ncbi:hypothetical protein GCM10009681_35930 [Luedemannella helvata]|uniref:DUF2154 domain-containing protein n=2 Tax=Luedemannella helvata TaxID=349315 RepID=A0ABN2KP48_9ACTN